MIKNKHHTKNIKYLVTTLTTITIFFLSISKVNASNKFGIHVLTESEFPVASNLVNSDGRQWGYVTFVIREDEMDKVRWTRAFQKLSEYKLTPIVRIATKQEGGMWVKPKAEMAPVWADFLSSLPWPNQKRIVSLWNEPNHSKEWGGEIDPAEYATLSRKYWEELKKASFDFFVLPAGFDAAAPNGRATMNSKDFFDQMSEHDPLIFTLFDGWASHSYPNPGFSGSPSDNGKMSIRGFEWELNYLEKYHLTDGIPVYIKETGWANRGGNQEKIADYYKQAFTEAWSHPQVVAVTPFILRYDNAPFDQFSWIIPKTDVLYPYGRVMGASDEES